MCAHSKKCNQFPVRDNLTRYNATLSSCLTLCGRSCRESASESWNAECTVFFAYYCMLHWPVLIVIGADSHSPCLVMCVIARAHVKRTRSWVSKKTLSAEAWSFSSLTSTSHVLKNNISVTWSKHSKCQQLFMESFLQRRKNKVFSIC